MRAASSFAFVLVFLGGCHRCSPNSPSIADSASDAGDGDVPLGTTITIENGTTTGVQVYIAFGSNSVVLPTSPGWSFCTQYQTYALVCDFLLAPSSIQTLPLNGQYMGATVSFGGPVSCGFTKVEWSVNQTSPSPGWYDTADVSLVDGFNVGVAIEYKDPFIDGGHVILGPVKHERGNEKAFGVFPLACDLCTARSAQTPCGYVPGPSPECKKGTQYHPDVVCQYQGNTMSGTDTEIKVLYLGPPADEGKPSL